MNGNEISRWCQPDCFRERVYIGISLGLTVFQGLGFIRLGLIFMILGLRFLATCQFLMAAAAAGGMQGACADAEPAGRNWCRACRGHWAQDRLLRGSPNTIGSPLARKALVLDSTTHASPYPRLAIVTHHLAIVAAYRTTTVSVLRVLSMILVYCQ